MGRREGTQCPAGTFSFPSPQRRHSMLKFLGSAIGIVFLIGLLVVIGLLALIF